MISTGVVEELSGKVKLTARKAYNGKKGTKTAKAEARRSRCAVDSTVGPPARGMHLQYG